MFDQDTNRDKMTVTASLHDVVRDAPLGQVIRFFTNNRFFKYPEEQSDFEIPESYSIRMREVDHEGMLPSPETLASSTVYNSDREHKATETTKDTSILVGWYNENDTANPHNWSNLRRAFLASLICAYTFVVYLSSAIYASSTEGVMEEFKVGKIKASLGLAMYVLGYGVGPLLFSPLSEIPRIGRNPVYIITMGIFVIISIPTALEKTFAGLIILRFLQGFFGSPCLASGGASMSDMYSMVNLPFALIAWVGAMSCGREFDLSTR